MLAGETQAESRSFTKMIPLEKSHLLLPQKKSVILLSLFTPKVFG